MDESPPVGSAEDVRPMSLSASDTPVALDLYEIKQTMIFLQVCGVIDRLSSRAQAMEGQFGKYIRIYKDKVNALLTSKFDAIKNIKSAREVAQLEHDISFIRFRLGELLEIKNEFAGNALFEQARFDRLFSCWFGSDREEGRLKTYSRELALEINRLKGLGRQEELRLKVNLARVLTKLDNFIADRVDSYRAVYNNGVAFLEEGDNAKQAELRELIERKQYVQVYDEMVCLRENHTQTNQAILKEISKVLFRSLDDFYEQMISEAEELVPPSSKVTHLEDVIRRVNTFSANIKRVQDSRCLFEFFSLQQAKILEDKTTEIGTVLMKQVNELLDNIGVLIKKDKFLACESKLACVKEVLKKYSLSDVSEIKDRVAAMDRQLDERIETLLNRYREQYALVVMMVDQLPKESDLAKQKKPVLMKLNQREFEITE